MIFLSMLRTYAAGNVAPDQLCLGHAGRAEEGLKSVSQIKSLQFTLPHCENAPAQLRELRA